VGNDSDKQSLDMIDVVEGLEKPSVGRPGLGGVGMAFEGLRWCVVSTLLQVVSRWCRLRLQPISFEGRASGARPDWDSRLQ